MPSFHSFPTVIFGITRTTRLLKLVCYFLLTPNRQLTAVQAYEVHDILMMHPLLIFGCQAVTLSAFLYVSAPAYKFRDLIKITVLSLLLIEYVAATASGNDAENAIARKDKRPLPIPVRHFRVTAAHNRMTLIQFCCWRYRPTKACRVLSFWLLFLTEPVSLHRLTSCTPSKYLFHALLLRSLPIDFTVVRPPICHPSSRYVHFHKAPSHGCHTLSFSRVHHWHCLREIWCSLRSCGLQCPLR